MGKGEGMLEQSGIWRGQSRELVSGFTFLGICTLPRWL